MSRFSRDIRRAVARGDLPQRFRPEDVRHACPAWASHTYGVFLPKHRRVEILAGIRSTSYKIGMALTASSAEPAGLTLPPAEQGLPDCHGVGASVRRCMPGGVRHPGGQADRQPRRIGQAVGTPARTIRMPPVSSIWIPGRRWAPGPDHPAGPNPAGGRARERRGGIGRRGPGRQDAGRCGCPDRPSSYSGITLSDDKAEENAPGAAVLNWTGPFGPACWRRADRG